MSDEEYQININSDVRYELDNYLKEGESYSIAIERLFDEIGLLKEYHDRLMRMLMKTPDSHALPNVSHRTYFAIFEVLRMPSQDDEDKLNSLKIYLRPSIEENPRIVLSCIASIKEEHDGHSSILDDLTEWILNTFPY